MRSKVFKHRAGNAVRGGVHLAAPAQTISRVPDGVQGMQKAGGEKVTRDRAQSVNLQKRAGILIMLIGVTARNVQNELTARNAQNVQSGLIGQIGLIGQLGQIGQTGVLQNLRAGSSSLIRQGVTLPKDPILKSRKSQIRIKSASKIIAKKTERRARGVGLMTAGLGVISRLQAKSQDRVQNLIQNLILNLGRFAQKPNPMKGAQISRNIKNQVREAHRAPIAVIIPGQMMAASFV